MNEEAKIVRKRKERIGEHLYEANHHLRQILWIHPNDAPVYLDIDQVQSFRDMERTVKEILERHEATEEYLCPCSSGQPETGSLVLALFKTPETGGIRLCHEQNVGQCAPFPPL